MELCANNEEVINKQSLQSEGFCVVKNVLKPETCLLLRELYAKDQHYRSTIDMQRYNFGRGQYRYFNYPFPEIISRLRRYFYENLVDCTNQRTLHEMKFPADFYAFEQSQYEANQAKPTPLVLKYQEGDYNWSTEYIALRALGDQNAFPENDVFLQKMLTNEHIDCSKPFRAYIASYCYIYAETMKNQNLVKMPTVQPLKVNKKINLHKEAFMQTNGFYEAIYRSPFGLVKLQANDQYLLSCIWIINQLVSLE